MLEQKSVESLPGHLNGLLKSINVRHEGSGFSVYPNFMLGDGCRLTITPGPRNTVEVELVMSDKHWGRLPRGKTLLLRVKNGSLAYDARLRPVPGSKGYVLRTLITPGYNATVAISVNDNLVPTKPASVRRHKSNLRSQNLTGRHVYSSRNW